MKGSYAGQLVFVLGGPLGHSGFVQFTISCKRGVLHSHAWKGLIKVYLHLSLPPTHFAWHGPLLFSTTSVALLFLDKAGLFPCIKNYAAQTCSALLTWGCVNVSSRYIDLWAKKDSDCAVTDMGNSLINIIRSLFMIIDFWISPIIIFGFCTL
jgi:hypothetical protein